MWERPSTVGDVRRDVTRAPRRRLPSYGVAIMLDPARRVRSTNVSRRTKIVCTLGPATATPDRIRELIQAGMDVARLNFSHGDREDHKRVYDMIRAGADS